LTSQGFPPELSIDPLKYESWQPPLYYLLAAPLYLISSGDLLTLRLFSLSFGAGVIVFAYLTGREVLPDKPLVAVTAAGFIAFIPQHIAMMAGINNDSLSELLIAVGLWLIVRLNGRGLENWRIALLGLILALAIITKSQAYVLIPVAGLMLLFRWWRNLRYSLDKSPISNLQSFNPLITDNQSLVTQFSILFLPALFAGSLFWGRNLAIYGWPDFMGAIRHDQVVADQPRTADWAADFGAPEVVRRFFQTTFQSFWGQFGWMGVPMPGKYYWALGVYTVILGMGLAIYFWRIRELKNSPISNPRITNYYLLTTSALLTLALYLYYNLTYVQHQGRYLFPALVPISLAASLSLWKWGEIVAVVLRRPSAAFAWLVPTGALAGMAALSLFALYRFVLPSL
jgi:hypothetical protein